MAGGSSYRMKESTQSNLSDKALMDIGLISKSCTLELLCLRIKRLIDIVGTGTKNDRIPIIITTNEFNY